VYNGNNQINGASYDAAGNQLVANGDTLSYDAENRMISAAEPPSLGGATETYVYDGSGQRVQKTGPGGTTTYVYDAFGNLAAEYGAVAKPSCATCYVSWDHLGSVRILTGWEWDCGGATGLPAVWGRDSGQQAETANGA
jgi:YD repeat-containing protein